MIADERETTIAYTDASEEILIYSCIRKDITAMKKKEQFTLVDEGKLEDGTLYANFTIPRDKFDIARAAKGTRTMTDEQKKAQADRLAEARQKRAQNKE